MKITKENAIKTIDKELIDRLVGDLDWHAIRDIVQEKYRIQIQEGGEYRQGDIVVHNNDVAYKLDFDVKITLSVLFDRFGDYLSVTPSLEAEQESQQEGVTPYVEDFHGPKHSGKMDRGPEMPEEKNIIELTDIVQSSAEETEEKADRQWG